MSLACSFWARRSSSLDGCMHGTGQKGQGRQGYSSRHLTRLLTLLIKLAGCCRRSQPGEGESRTSQSESRNFMEQMRAAAVRSLDAEQAAELSLLVELEARWENLRKTPRTQDQEARSIPEDLQAIQNAYDAFHSKLIAYNQRYTPAHVPELLLNTPSRLALWCRTM